MCVVSLPMYDIGLQLLGVRDDSYQIDVCVMPTDSVRRPWLRRPMGCWTVDFDSHVQHYSNWRHKPQSREVRLWLVFIISREISTLGLTQFETQQGNRRHQTLYQPKCSDALRLGCKGRYGSFHLWITCGWQVKLCDLLLTRAIPERFRDESW